MAAPGDVAAERDRWALDLLLRRFNRFTGRWRMPTGEAWQPALAIEAVLTAYDRTGDPAYRRVVERSFARYRGRRSEYLDDDGWYLNAWLRAYDSTGEPKYLAEAEELFAVMAGAWDARCGGGLWWHAPRTYKNAITNELFLLAASGLHRRTGEPAGTGEYLDWARRIWAWFDASGLINPDGLVNDGLDPATCANNGQTTWTYNQGVLLSALVELWRCTGETALLDRARTVADATIAALTRSQILSEPTEPDATNVDAHVFKGILAQGLARLYRADPAARPEYRDFLIANADAAWDRARDPARGIALGWSGPATPVTAATHASACLLLGEVATLSSSA
jgi:predicted alpha-1,6-mannanase (GH76 family)